MKPSLSLQERIPVLDGLRFLAAFTVIVAHYVGWVVGDQGVQNLATRTLGTLSGIGMPLFFVLSGFVIHYNYHSLPSQEGGIKKFFIARFTRLYPLYITLFLIEFYIVFKMRRGSCGHAGERMGLFLALPYYLTLTQDWVYGIIGKNNLIYQYYMVSAVAWSISLEFFFYFSYPILARWLIKQNKTVRQILWIVITQTGTVLFLVYCERHIGLIEHVASVGFGQYATLQQGYQDSLLRWLLYFNPLVNLPAFFSGMLIANLYMQKKSLPHFTWEKRWGGLLTFMAFSLFLFSHFFIYLYVAKRHSFFGRTGSVLTVPLIVLFIFCLTRYSSTILNRILSLSIFVKLGEASYSIYLLHAFFGFYPRDFYYLHLNPWILYLLAITFILGLSRLSYLLFERPVQRFLRQKLQPQEKKIPIPISEEPLSLN